MKTCFLFLILYTVGTHNLYAQEAPVFEWAKSFGINSSYDVARSITTDALGNVFTTGWYRNTIDFDPGPGVFNLTASGFDDRGSYILKLDPDGNFLWAKTLNSTLDCFTGAITTDAAGNLYITGLFDGTVDFDPGPGTFNITNSGTFDGNFICKLDADGNFLWATHTSSNNSQALSAITVDAAQNVYTLGHFRGTVDFDSGPGTAVLTPLGQWDAYLSKADANGNFIAVQRFGGTDFDFGHTLDTDAAGNVYLSGVFQGTADFDPGAGTFTMTSTGLRDVFVVKLTEAGNFVWAKRLGEATTDELTMTIETDASGNIYGTGLYSGIWDFDPGASTFNLTSTSGTDFYLLKLDSNGDFVWAKSMGSATHDDRVTDLAVNTTGVYVTGYFNGTGDFDPGTSVFSVTAENDSYILKLDVNGNFVWVALTGDYGSGTITKVMAVDPSGNIFSTGGFNAPLDADPDPCAVFELTTGYIYVQKLSIGVGNTGPLAEITANGTILTASSGDAYQWYLNNVELQGATNQSIELSLLEYGAYKVAVTDQGCTATSDDYIYLITENEVNLDHLIQVYPNPFNDLISIQWDSNEPAVIQLTDLLGREIRNQFLTSGINEIHTEALSHGMYVLTIKTKSKSLIKKVKK